MMTHVHLRPITAVPLLAAAALVAAGCSADTRRPASTNAVGWSDTNLNAISPPVIGGGVVAVTALRSDGMLQTAVDDLHEGKRLWTKPATMVGRPSGFGVASPAVAGSADHRVVADVERTGSGSAAVVGRDARSGDQRWTYPVTSTYGPTSCGAYVCLTENTAKQGARFTVLDSTTGRPVWNHPGTAEVEQADSRRIVTLRMGKQPAVNAYDPGSGRALWTFPVARALGPGVDLSGGWILGASGDRLIGYVSPYQAAGHRSPSPYGFFAVRLSDGRRLWARPRLLRVYPSGNPAVSLVAREVQGRQYGGFTRLDPATGRSVVRIPAQLKAQDEWWLAFPGDLSRLDLLGHDRPGRAYDLRTGESVPADPEGWSFCSTRPSPLKIKGLQGFFSTPALCAYDVRTGRRVAASTPPNWYTGATDGWRAWRDGNGALHGLSDGSAAAPGMYG